MLQLERTTADYKLRRSRGITIRAEEVIVEIAAPAPDYVFEEDYKLRTLSEVESFVKENKHLPDVPAGESMEENGIGVAENEYVAA